MNKLVWEYIEPLENQKSIEEFEYEKRIILPKYLKNFIEENNGATPNMDIFTTKNGKELQIKSLLSFNKSDIENIYKVIDYFKEKYKGKIIPFATEPSGNYFCIDLDNGKIVYWNQESEETEIIAESFSDFLNGLQNL